MRSAWLLTFALACNGKGCGPELPDVSTDTGPPSDAPTDPTDVTDPTDPPPGPCPIPEREPNDAPESATPLPLEAQACGAFQATFDFDMWSFELPEAAWLRLKIVSRDNGAWADPRVALDGPTPASSVLIDDKHNSPDVDLRFPAEPGPYLALVSELNAQGDADHYKYELLASVAKPPVEWTATAPEPDNSFAQALRVANGDRIFANFLGIGDQDHYRIDVPPGKTELTLDVEAFAFGSAAWVSLSLFNDDGRLLENEVYGPEGWERDAQLRWTSTGNETLYLKTSDYLGTTGLATWHVISFRMETE